MAFETISQLPTAQQIIQKSLDAARAVKTRKRPGELPADHHRKHERERITAITTSIRAYLNTIERQFPSISELSEFYRELLKLTAPIDETRARLGKIKASKQVIADLGRRFKGKLASAATVKEIRSTMQVCIGRISSVVKRLSQDLKHLEKVRIALQKFPTIKKQFTICIAGFPNVGKTTLLTKLTTSKAEVNEYAFTTKQLNIGYCKVEHKKVQMIDTPGTLNRDHLNTIELYAHLALKYVADVIIYVFDPTFTYSKEKQEALYEAMKQYDKPTYVYLSKTDIASKKQQEYFHKTYNPIAFDDLQEFFKRLIA